LYRGGGLYIRLVNPRTFLRNTFITPLEHEKPMATDTCKLGMRTGPQMEKMRIVWKRHDVGQSIDDVEESMGRISVCIPIVQVRCPHIVKQVCEIFAQTPAILDDCCTVVGRA